MASRIPNVHMVGVVQAVKVTETDAGTRVLLTVTSCDTNRPDLLDGEGNAHVYVVNTEAATIAAVSVQPGARIRVRGMFATNGTRNWIAARTAPHLSAENPGAIQPKPRKVRKGEQFDAWNVRSMKRRRFA